MQDQVLVTTDEGQPLAAVPEYPGRTHLFISYATENEYLAKWLARKLAALGYAVWFDQLKLLGGEPWPKTIDVAIKERSFRMLALLSVHSIDKPNPSKERTLALRLAKEKDIPDFMIPIKVDDVDLDWLTSDLTYIPFNHGTARGWQQLLKKLESIGTPRSLATGGELAAKSFEPDEPLVADEAEPLRANVIPIDRLPSHLQVYAPVPSSVEFGEAELKDAWPFYRISDRVYISWVAPPDYFRSSFVAEGDPIAWSSEVSFLGVATQNIVRYLILKALDVRLVAAGVKRHPTLARTYFLDEHFTSDGRLHFRQYEGKKTWLKIKGRIKFWRSAGKSEINYHHFAFKVGIAKNLEDMGYIQVTPSLVFYSEVGNLIHDKGNGARRARLTKGWWNDKWLKRLMAVQQLIAGLDTTATEGLCLASGLLQLNASKRILEDKLEQSTPAEEEVVADAEEIVELDLNESDDEPNDE